MRKHMWAAAGLLVVLVLILTACGGAAGKSAAAGAVENYLQAVVSKDSAKVSTLSCKTWESSALLEMDAFQAVKAELVGVTCKENGKDGASTLVTCTGKIDTTYNAEVSSLDVSRQTYQVVQEGGDYRVCGEK